MRFLLSITSLCADGEGMQNCSMNLFWPCLAQNHFSEIDA
jgi:hypothetical protein